MLANIVARLLTFKQWASRRFSKRERERDGRERTRRCSSRPRLSLPVRDANNGIIARAQVDDGNASFRADDDTRLIHLSLYASSRLSFTTLEACVRVCVHCGPPTKIEQIDGVFSETRIMSPPRGSLYNDLCSRHLCHVPSPSPDPFRLFPHRHVWVHSFLRFGCLGRKRERVSRLARSAS